MTTLTDAEIQVDWELEGRGVWLDSLYPLIEGKTVAEAREILLREKEATRKQQEENGLDVEYIQETAEDYDNYIDDLEERLEEGTVWEGEVRVRFGREGDVC